MMEKNNAGQKKDETPRIPLGIILRENKAATKDQIDAALKIQAQERESTKSAEAPKGKSRLIGEILVKDFGVSQDEVDKAFKAQSERQDMQKRLEAKLLESGGASQEQIKKTHDKQLEAIKKDEIPKDFKELLEDARVKPDAIKQAEAAARKDIEMEKIQSTLEEKALKPSEATKPVERSAEAQKA